MKIRPEVRVGLFVAVLLVVLLWSALKLTGQRGVWRGGYRVSVTLESAEGLRSNGFVKMAGVPIGQIESIDLVANRARVHVRVREDVRLTEDCLVTAKTTGILGDRYLEIRDCTDKAPPIEDGGEIKRVGISVSLDEITGKLASIADNIQAVTDAMSRVLGGRKGEQELGAMVEDLRGTIHTVRQIVEENRAKLSDSMTSFQETARALGESVPEIAERLERAAADVQEFVAANRDRLQGSVEQFDQLVRRLTDSADSLKNITGKIDRGEGTLGKLVNDPALANSLTKTIEDVQGAVEKISRIKIGVEYRGEVSLAERVEGGTEPTMKNYVSIRAQPRPDKYFRFGIVVDPLSADIRQNRNYTKDGQTVGDPEITATQEDVKFSVEIAKKFGFLTLRGGVLENTGGVGMDLHFFREAAMLSAEGFDFGRDAGPHLKVRAEYTFLRYVTANVGWDDPVYQPSLLERKVYFEEFDARRRSSVFFGAGLRFTDEDIKTLLPFIPGL
ncbi:MAG: MCE family protein [Nitrospirae bacterium]|nr:MCE family protein [Nitrospirota bacterium]